MISRLDTTYDLFLGYSWSAKPQGISGHLYECIEYYFFLKQYMKVGIVVCEDMPWDTIDAAVRSKYDFTDDEVAQLKADTYFFFLPKVLYGPNLLLVDGNFAKLKETHLLFKNLMAFPCGNLEYCNMPNVTAFQDNRIYGERERHKHYVKKLLFSRYRNIGPSVSDVNMLYATGGPREVSDSIFAELEQQYSGNFLLLTNVPITTELSDRFTVAEMPAPNLFEKFSTYIYTPTRRKFDCSPRFIAECEWYGKDVVYHNIDYWHIDLGLFWRKHDIDHDFNGIVLHPGDDIVDLIKGVIND